MKRLHGRAALASLLSCMFAAVIGLSLSVCGGAGASSASSGAASASASAQPAQNRSADDQAVVDQLVADFELLAAVPRPSHHEEQISAFLKNWAEEQGFSVVQDEVGNIVFDVPATAGYEGLPLTILQGRMDMVCAVEDGKEFDPLKDPIEVINDGVTLTANGTSLGGDDGSGVAAIMGIARGAMDHGPLRVLITVNEEDGMDGAFNLDKAHLQDAKYLINIDNETSNAILVSTAASDTINVSGTVSPQAPTRETAVSMVLKGLKGGHSGVELAIADIERPAAVLPAAERDATLKFCTDIVNGVNTMSADLPDLVESSSNLGLFAVDANGVSATASVRSSSASRQTEVTESHISLAGECGYEVVKVKTADPWAYNPNSRLLVLYQEAYKEVTGEDAIVEAVHAGLECGTWAVLNPDLDMISIGPDISDAHTTSETLYLDSLAKVWRVLERVLVSVE